MPWRYKDLLKRIKCLEEDNLSLKRILENYVPGKITHKTISTELTYIKYISSETYIYKNGKEYYFGGIPLYNPKFKEIDEDTIIITDEIYKKKYIFQFSTAKRMEVEWEK